MTIDIEQLKADRDAGTPGPWALEKLASGTTYVGIMKAGGKSLERVICHFDTGPHKTGAANARDEADARRISRAPYLEAEVIRLTERLRLYEGQESTPGAPVGFDGMVSEMSGTIQHQSARIAALEAKLKTVDRGVWRIGAPDKISGSEWFIAKDKHGRRCVFRALDDDYSYNYEDGFGTYYSDPGIVAWMQFPDSHFLPPDTETESECPYAKTKALEAKVKAADGCQWQPIETAPKDGTLIDLRCEADNGTTTKVIRLTDCSWHESDDIFQWDGWIRVCDDGNWDAIECPPTCKFGLPAWTPTHWMPRPDLSAAYREVQS